MPGIYQYFCPICVSTQNTFEQWVEGRLQLRCQLCGYPVEEGIPSEGEVTFHKKKILFIDDEKTQLQIFADVMKQHEFQPLTAIDGPSGIALAVQDRPALILIDVMMPKMDGYEVCRQLRALPALHGTPLVIFTALSDPKLSSKGFQAGADLAMTKTFASEKLVPILRTLLWLKDRQGKGRTAD